MADRLSPARAQAVAALIWPPGTVGPDEEGRKAYLLLDAARNPGIHRSLIARQAEIPIRSLYQGELAQNLADVCPYIVALPPGAPFAEWLIDQGWGDSWGVFVHATGSIDAVRRHFRRFTVVNTEDGRALLFRFYDPRVLRVFLPTCESDQIAAFFRDIDACVVEGEEGASVHQFACISGSLRHAHNPLAG